MGPRGGGIYGGAYYRYRYCCLSSPYAVFYFFLDRLHNGCNYVRTTGDSLFCVSPGDRSSV